MTSPALQRHWGIVGYRIKGDRSSKVVPALYTVWTNFRRRCTTDSPVYYRWYKAKGIKVCDEWNDYATFRKWALANGFRKGLQIDREDGRKGYEPGNCRWVTREVQMQNRTFTRRGRKLKPVKWYPGAKGKVPRWYVAQLLIPC